MRVCARTHIHMFVKTVSSKSKGWESDRKGSLRGKKRTLKYKTNPDNSFKKENIKEQWKRMAK